MITQPPIYTRPVYTGPLLQREGLRKEISGAYDNANLT
jgi:hypothetical protein